LAIEKSVAFFIWAENAEESCGENSYSGRWWCGQTWDPSTPQGELLRESSCSAQDNRAQSVRMCVAQDLRDWFDGAAVVFRGFCNHVLREFDFWERCE